MSKDLEKEYKALVDSEAPDLWARIGAGLEEKAAHSHREELTKKSGIIRYGQVLRQHVSAWL